MAATTTDDELRPIALADLQLHNTRGQAWVAVRGKVYDLTRFIPRHPGGEGILLAASGRDVTQVFEGSHGPTQQRILKSFLVGKLVGGDMPTFHPESAFGSALKARVRQYFKDGGLDHKTAPWMFARYAFVTAGMLASYCALFYGQSVADSVPLFVLAVVLSGFFQAMHGLHQLHDGSHACQTHSPAVWNFMATQHDFLNGLSSLLWMYQHILGHHPYTNIDGADPDIVTQEAGFRMIKRTQKWHPLYMLQHIYAPMLYCFLGAKNRIDDILAILGISDWSRLNPLTTKDKVIFWGGKAFWLTTRLIAPLYFSPMQPAKVVAAFFLSDFVFSWYLALVFEASHVVDEVEWPLPDENNVIQMDWAQMQVETAQDYGHDSWLTTVMTGSLNYQVVHHLFPNISQYHYPALAPIVKQTCQEFGVNYRIRSSFWEAFGGHIGLLKYLGSGEAVFGHQPHREESSAKVEVVRSSRIQTVEILSRASARWTLAQDS